MSLQGKRIVITRAAHQIESMANLLREQYQAIPIIFPCIAIQPTENTDMVDNILKKISDFDWLILTSRNTVRVLAERINKLDLSIEFPKIAVVGSSTATLAKKLLHVSIDFVPDVYSSDTLGFLMTIRNNEKVLLPQSAKADNSLANALRNQGAHVTVITAYENTVGTGGDDVPAMLAFHQIDALTFTSGSTIEGFIERTQPFDARQLPAACIGESTAQVAQEYGFKQIIVPKTYTIETMIEALYTFFAEQEQKRD